MVLLWAVLIGLSIGILRKGTLRQLGRIDLRYTWLVLASFLIQLLIFPFFKEEPLVGFWTPFFHAISYFLVIVFTLLNIKIWQIGLIGLGTLSNVIVMAANGGYMPASVEALRKAGKDFVAQNLSQMEVYGNLIEIGRKSILGLLGDRFYLPDWMPFSSAFSIGDGLIALGIVLLLADKMVETKTSSTKRKVSG